MSEYDTVQDESIGSDDDYTPGSSSTNRGRRSNIRGGSAARGSKPGARGRGRGRGRGQRRRQQGPDTISEEDMIQVEDMRAQRIADEQARIRRLNLEESHQLLELCLEREPSLIFDILSMSVPRPAPSDPQQPGPSAPPSQCPPNNQLGASVGDVGR